MCMPLALHQPFALFKQAFLSQYTSVNRITSFLIFCIQKSPTTFSDRAVLRSKIYVLLSLLILPNVLCKEQKQFLTVLL